MCIAQRHRKDGAKTPQEDSTSLRSIWRESSSRRMMRHFSRWLVVLLMIVSNTSTSSFSVGAFVMQNSFGLPSALVKKIQPRGSIDSRSHHEGALGKVMVCGIAPV